MVFNFEAIIYYFVLVDAIIGNLTIWFPTPNYKKLYQSKYWLSRFLPVTKGWMGWYLILMLWLGYGLYRVGVLPY